MLTRYPERFGALFCTIPLIEHAPLFETARGGKLDCGIWRSRQAGRMGLLQTYRRIIPPGRDRNIRSILPRPRGGRSRPSGHARKMAAKLQAMGIRAYFYEPPPRPWLWKDNKHRAGFTALGFSS